MIAADLPTASLIMDPHTKRQPTLTGPLEFLPKTMVVTMETEVWIMRIRSKFRPSLLAGPLVFWSAVANAGSVAVTVSGIVPNGTVILAAVCTSELEPASCGTGERRAAASPTMRFVFDGLAPGKYAIAAYQDLNGNGYLDSSKLGLPLEPFGFSNEAGRGARPSFNAAAFSLGEGRKEIFVRLRSIARQNVPAD
jgi:uncharacterized protein (DUF2141 family)